MLTETQQEKIEVYKGLLIKWNRAVNLVSPATIDALDVRHIDDSLQAVELIQRGAYRSVSDIGSGGGLPVIPLAIACPAVSFVAVESDAKKAEFLRQVSRETKLGNLEVRSTRIEKINDLTPDCVTARALARLDRLFELTQSIAGPSTDYLFWKGEKATDEIDLTQKAWQFEVHQMPSKTQPGASILLCKNVLPKN